MDDIEYKSFHYKIYPSAHKQKTPYDLGLMIKIWTYDFSPTSYSLRSIDLINFEKSYLGPSYLSRSTLFIQLINPCNDSLSFSQTRSIIFLILSNFLLRFIIDINSLIILGKTKDCVNLDPIQDKISGLGINTLEVDGHNLSDLISTFEKSKTIGELNCILAKTVKGKGSSLMENKKNWHYWNAMSDEEIEKTRKELS